MSRPDPVLEAVRALDRELLEAAVYDVLCALYAERDDRWNADKEWSSDTAQEIAEGLPASLVDAIREATP